MFVSRFRERKWDTHLLARVTNGDLKICLQAIEVVLLAAELNNNI